MKIRKKYKFETAYTNEEGFQGSSFEMFVTFVPYEVSKNGFQIVDDFIDQFDHANMYSAQDKKAGFLAQSQRTIVLDAEPVDVTPFKYGVVTLLGIDEKIAENIVKIEINDTKDTEYILDEKAISLILDNRQAYKFEIK